MNYEAAIRIAEQRMFEMGIPCERYHLDFVTVVGKKAERVDGHIIIQAFNEYLYLINFQNYYGLQIICESAFFDSDEMADNTIEEFTGTIHLVKIADSWNLKPKEGEAFYPVEFLRVTIH